MWMRQLYDFPSADEHWMIELTHKQLETHGCELGTVATDALVLMHQAISTNSTD